MFRLKNIHTFGPNIRLIRLFSLMLIHAKPRLAHVSLIMLQILNVVKTDKSESGFI